VLIVVCLMERTPRLTDHEHKARSSVNVHVRSSLLVIHQNGVGQASEASIRTKGLWACEACQMCSRLPALQVLDSHQGYRVLVLDHATSLYATAIAMSGRICPSSVA
jgi:hypothetical protein